MFRKGNVSSVEVVVYHAGQCDPKKCTALKLEHHGLVRLVPKIKYLPNRAVMLNPFSKIAFSPADRQRIQNWGLSALDCSWKQAKKVLSNHVRGTSRCLPFLLAGNPVNFSKPTKLSTVEALAAALLIAGFNEEADRMLSLFKWGHTFTELNREMLDYYQKAEDSTEIIKLQTFFIRNMRTSHG
ncbi:MAG: DUF367 family protein [Thermoproteota archaeon]